MMVCSAVCEESLLVHVYLCTIGPDLYGVKLNVCMCLFVHACVHACVCVPLPSPTEEWKPLYGPMGCAICKRCMPLSKHASYGMMHAKIHTTLQAYMSYSKVACTWAGLTGLTNGKV